MRTTSADYARQSDPYKNRHFRRKWADTPLPALPGPTQQDDDGGASNTLAVLLQWRDQWRAERRRAGQ
jgi:hypothetical protein